MSRSVSLAAAILLCSVFGFTGRAYRPVPPLLFVSRNAPADTAQIPGFGPEGRTLSPGGQLLKRDPSGRLRSFLPAGILFDVSDPAVSWDGRLVALSGRVHPDSAWRLWVCDARGRDLHAITGPGTGDDLDPCWLPDGRLVFSSTRYAMESLANHVPVSNLFSIHADGTGLARVTLDRNGAEEPTVDVKSGRIVYARWWFNPFLPTEVGTSGITRNPGWSAAAEEIDLWQAIAVLPDGDGMKLAGGNPKLAGGVSLYQPAILPDGTVVGIEAAHPSLSPAPGATRLVSFKAGFSTPRSLTARGRAASPSVLPDGRLVFAWAPAGTSDMDLYLSVPESGEIRRLGGLPGRLDLDPVFLGARAPVAFPKPLLEPPSLSSAFTLEQVHTTDRTFRFDCLNVFMNGPVDAPFPDALPAGQGIRIRFYTLLPRPASAGGDSLVLIREAPVTTEGAVHEHELPADIPMFEQLVDADGRVLRNAHGLAHVPGFNFARMGSGTKCVGCHTGHSALPAPKNNEMARWFNAASSARVTASSSVAGTAGPRGAVDRRTRGALERVAWIAEGLEGQSLDLAWGTPLEIRALTLYAPRDDRRGGTRLRIDAVDLVFTRNGREVGRRVVTGPIAADGTRVELGAIPLDGLSVRLRGVTGQVRHRPVAALAEIAVETRLAAE